VVSSDGHLQCRGPGARPGPLASGSCKWAFVLPLRWSVIRFKFQVANLAQKHCRDRDWTPCKVTVTLDLPTQSLSHRRPQAVLDCDCAATRRGPGSHQFRSDFAVTIVATRMPEEPTGLRQPESAIGNPGQSVTA
jgi:hypothetical protein